MNVSIKPAHTTLGLTSPKFATPQRALVALTSGRFALEFRCARGDKPSF